MNIQDNIFFYTLIVGVTIGIIISYSNLLTFFLGIVIGLCYKNKSLFDYINELSINQLKTA